MIDIHSHLLCKIDDGAKTLEDSINLAKYAVNNGITHSVLTPHIQYGRYDNNIQSISTAFHNLSNALSENKIPLKIAYGAEVRIDISIIQMIEKNEIPFLGTDNNNNQYLLLEMPHSHILAGSNNLIKWLLDRNIIPVIAHPERNKELQQNYDKAYELIQMGCLFQLTAASVSGVLGKICQLAANKFLEEDWVKFVATDAHNIQYRPPDLFQSKSFLIKIVGEKEAENLLIHNAWKIVKSKFSLI